MSWASSRRTLILAVLGAVFALVAAGTLIATLYEAPSCADGKRNQDEQGIDCGGACAKLCTASQAMPVVSFVRDLQQQSGRLDVIAYVENPNPFAAARDVRYEIEFIGESGTSLGSKSGTVDLPPASEVPIFLPSALSDGLFVRQAFLTFDEASLNWYEPGEELRPFGVEGVATGGTEEAPRVTATITNPSVEHFYNVKVIATVFDADGNAIAASQTLIGELRALNEAPVVFTWTAPFRSPPARIDVRAVREL